MGSRSKNNTKWLTNVFPRFETGAWRGISLMYSVD
jgi:hypothetical protein